MSRIRLVLVSVVAVLSTVAMLASSASAKIKFEWQVGGTGTNGTLLAAGQTRAFTSITDGKNFDFHGVLGSAEVLVLSNKVSVKGGAQIFGGKPGTGAGTAVFENVTVDKPSGCVVENAGVAHPTPGIVETVSLKGEIVESQSSGEPLMLITPQAGTTFVELLFLKNGTEACAGAGLPPAKVTGSILGEPLPPLKETLNGDVDFEASGKEFLLNAGGAAEIAGLAFASKPATLTGLILSILTTDEKYGAF